MTWKDKYDAGNGRVGKAIFVYPDDEPDKTFVLKLQRGGLSGPDTGACRHEEEILRLGMERVPERMPRLVDVGEREGQPFLVMESLECIDYPIPEAEFRAFCVEAFTALNDVHEKGKLIHNDITPAHIARKNGHILFIDWHLSCPLNQAYLNRDCIGTPPYVAPEVASRGEISIHSDIWSLAKILYEQCPKGLRDCFQPVLAKELHVDPAERSPSAAAVAEQLRTCRPPHHRFKAAVKWTGCVVIAFFLISLAVYLIQLAIVLIEDHNQARDDADMEGVLLNIKKNYHSDAITLLKSISNRNGPRSDQASKMLKRLSVTEDHPSR